MIDLRSDTVTKPTEEMRKAMYMAEVGDDVYQEDPTVRELEETAAELLGKESALFVTSGTQGNQIAVLTHCIPGQEILLEAQSHIFYYESGAVAALAGVQTRTIEGKRGALDPIKVMDAIRSKDIHFPDTGLICVENTHNRAGGAVIPVENMRQVYEVAKKYDIPVHMDGARLFNAAAAAGVDVKEFSKYVDTVQICLSKGLGAPVGSLLAGNNDFINKARKWRKRLGGGMRQAGVIAAPGLIALTKMKDRLGIDQWNARILADGIEQIKGLKLASQPETNIVIADVSGLNITSDQFVENLRAEGVIAGTFGPTYVRFVTHFDVSEEQIQKSIDAIARIARKE